MLLLSDGTVIGQEGEYWSRLSPDAHGSYANGSWYAMPQSLMNTQRLYFGSAVLPNGSLFLVGGEYSTPAYTQNLTNLSETFDPLTNTWGYNAPFPQGNFGDDPVEVLPNGNVLAGYVFGPQTYIYDPSTDTWSNGPTKVNNDQSDEETWTRLPNGDILTYDIFSSISSGVFQGEIYNPNTNTWSATTNSTTNPPSQLSSPGIGYELGPAEVLPDGRVFQIGANGDTAFYDYRTNTWSAGPQILDATGQLFGSDDAPSAILPGGQVIFAADAGPSAACSAPDGTLRVRPDHQHDLANPFVEPAGGPAERPERRRLLRHPHGDAAVRAAGPQRLELPAVALHARRQRLPRRELAADRHSRRV